MSAGTNATAVPEDLYKPVALDQVEYHLAEVYKLLGYDLGDQHFAKTAERVGKWMWEFRKNGDPIAAGELLEAVFDDEHNSLVQVGPISVTSMCAHHGLPVTGFAWVGYIPDKRVVGLSKLARITHYFARQFTVQERVTQQIADALTDHLQPKGAMVVIEAAHGCMSLRGVKEPTAVTVTSAVRGVFKDEIGAREEFLRLMRKV